jgi:uncharacterized protein (TIGR02466 family)
MTGTPGLPHATGIFDTLVVVDEMPDAAALNQELRAVIARRRAENDGVRVSNIGGWQSDTGMLHWGGDPAIKLVRRMLDAAERFTVDVAAQGAPRHEWRAEMWANVSPPAASNQVHTHPGAFWSAVYYVDDGYGGSSDPAIGGELVLIDPRMPMIMMTMPTLRFRLPGRPADEPQLKLRPKTGRIVLFPSWLSHGVLPYAGTAERISIAVNLRAVPLAESR